MESFPAPTITRLFPWTTKPVDAATFVFYDWDFSQISVCAKTGTAQTGYSQPNGWFAPYAGKTGAEGDRRHTGPGAGNAMGSAADLTYTVSASADTGRPELFESLPPNGRPVWEVWDAQVAFADSVSGALDAIDAMT